MVYKKKEKVSPSATTPVLTPGVNKQFSDAIALINSYNQLLSDGTLETVIKNKTVLLELTDFVEERLGSLINFGKKPETFDSIEVKMLKNLLKKVGETPTRKDTVDMNVSVFRPMTENLTQALSQQNFTTVTATQGQTPVVTTQDNLDPIVKEALQSQEQELAQLPRIHKTVDRSPTQKIATPEDYNSYARSMASRANQTKDGVVDVRKLL